MLTLLELSENEIKRVFFFQVGGVIELFGLGLSLGF